MPLLLLALLGAVPVPQAPTRALAAARAQVGPGGFAMAVWRAKDLSGDLLGDSGLARVGVQLPHREADCLKRKARCWLVLYLPGFESSPEGTQRALAGVFRALDARPGADPLVVVMPDGRTRLGGGWYVDSPASGRWEHFLMHRLLPAARAALAPGVPPARTLVVGHSMGGFGALHLAAAHPHAFGAAAAFNPAACPAELAQEALSHLQARHVKPDLRARLGPSDRGHFFERLLLSLGAAFAPDRHRGVARLFDAAHQPWTLRPRVRRALLADDLCAHPQGLRHVARVQIYGARADPLIPTARLRRLAAGARVPLIVTPGNHVSPLASDLMRALQALARPGARRSTRRPARPPASRPHS